MMNAIVQNAYGGPEVLELTQIDVPTPGDTDVLVRIVAMSLHVGDVLLMRGVPYPARFAVGWPRPKGHIPGLSAAGVVEAVGSAVSGLRVGDSVFGEVRGASAQYALGTEKTLVPLPEGVSFEQAAALPTSGLAALHGLRDAAKVREGTRLAIIGAGGGVGHFEVQIAKSMGAHVTAVCGPSAVETVTSLGADEVVDYTTTDFVAAGPVFDVIFDNAGTRSFAELRPALKPDGIYIPNAGTTGTGAMLAGALRSLVVKQQASMYLSGPNPADLTLLGQMAQAGTLVPFIGARYELAQVPAAIGLIGKGHSHGKVVVTVGEA